MKKSQKQLGIEARMAADPLAQAVGRTDIDYSDPDQLPTAPRGFLHYGVEHGIPIKPQSDEQTAKGKIIGWKTEVTIFERKPTSDHLLNEGNAIADILIRTFSPEEREEVIWWVSRRVCFTCGIDTTDVQDHSHLIESDEIK